MISNLISSVTCQFFLLRGINGVARDLDSANESKMQRIKDLGRSGFSKQAFSSLFSKDLLSCSYFEIVLRLFLTNIIMKGVRKNKPHLCHGVY
jgi:hypothetical protein